MKKRRRLALERKAKAKKERTLIKRHTIKSMDNSKAVKNSFSVSPLFQDVLAKRKKETFDSDLVSRLVLVKVGQIYSKLIGPK